VSALGECEECIVRWSAEDVGRHQGDGSTIEALEGRPVGPVAHQRGDGPSQVTVGLGGAEGEHPADRQRRHAAWQRANRCGGAAVRPLQVVEADHDRLAQCGLLEERLDVLEQPVALLGEGVRVPEGRPLQEGRRSIEEGVHQHRELHGSVDGFGHTVADGEAGAPGSRHDLLQQAALAEPRPALDQPGGPHPGAEAVEMLVQRRQLVVPAAQGSWHRGGQP
jgi:hypothetical protein